MVKTRSQRAVEARVLIDFRLAFKIDEIGEAVFGQHGYDAVLLKTRVNYKGSDKQTAQFRNRGLLTGKLQTAGGLGKGGKDKRKAVTRSLNCNLREEIEIEEVLKKLEKLSKLVRTNAADSHSGTEDLVGNLTPVIGVGDEEDTVAKLIEWPRLKGARVEYPTAQFDYWLTLPLRNLAKYIMNMIGDCPTQLNWNFWEVILVCETQNGRWAASGSESRITAKDFLEYYAVKYVRITDGVYLSSSSSRPYFFDLSSAGRVWNDNLLWVSGECLHRSDEEPLELNNRTITKGINCKVSRKESFIDVVAREGNELEAVLKELKISRFKRVASKGDKLARLNEILNGPVDMASVSSTVVRNLEKRKAVKRGVAPRSVTSISVDDSSKRRKVTSPTKSQEVLEESDKIAEGANLRLRFEVKAGLLEEQCRAKAREKMVAVMDDEFKKFAHSLRDVQLGFQDRSMELEKRISQLEGEKNQLEENLNRERGAFQLEREKEREVVSLKLKEVRAESEAEAERLVTASAISRNNLAGKLYQLRYTKAEIMAFSEGNYEEMEIMDEEEVEEREDGLNVAERPLPITKKLLIRDFALNQLTSELAELKEKATSGSRHEAELAECHIRALNEEIFDMKCNIHALNEQLLKTEIELDTARTNLVVSEADFEKLSSSIVVKD
ncbi:hypothetical protein GIB67_035337 [Kingdonia uniflora]|uniref:Uncharacterized protein n=1 Tax=Kingdonia uniflora TaxID=39325 RepID=A0A7J7LYF7_9MAGN|nr:hypothetical protein GIB67_035337 [Kingdonia uniflora]